MIATTMAELVRGRLDSLQGSRGWFKKVQAAVSTHRRRVGIHVRLLEGCRAAHGVVSV